MAITDFFHLIHIVDDEDEVDAWYDKVFSPNRFLPKSWMDAEKRWASLSMIGDMMIEVIEPSAEPEDAGMPLTKFHTRFGQHYHSLAWYTDGGGIKPLFDRLQGRGVRIAKPGGGIWPPDGDVDPGTTIFTHPKDTFGQLEFQDVTTRWLDLDPRYQADWDADWQRDHPLGIRRVCHFTTIVTDLDAATALYVEAFDASVVHQEKRDDRESTFVFVGSETMIELARPTTDQGRLADDLRTSGELPHACTFLVRDLDTVQSHLSGLGLAVLDGTDDEIVLDPKDAFGALYTFRTTPVPGDPRT